MKKGTVSTISIIYEFIVLLLFVVSMVTFIAYSSMNRAEAYGESYITNKEHYDNITNFIIFISLFFTIYLLITAIVIITSVLKMNHSVKKDEFKKNAIFAIVFGILVGILMLNVDEDSLLEE